MPSLRNGVRNFYVDNGLAGGRRSSRDIDCNFTVVFRLCRYPKRVTRSGAPAEALGPTVNLRLSYYRQLTVRETEKNRGHH